MDNMSAYIILSSLPKIKITSAYSDKVMPLLKAAPTEDVKLEPYEESTKLMTSTFICSSLLASRKIIVSFVTSSIRPPLKRYSCTESLRSDVHTSKLSHVIAKETCKKKHCSASYE